MFSYQHYLWSHDGWALSPVIRVDAASYEEAARIALGKPIASAGPIRSVALKVWPTGRAKRSSDVRHYWEADKGRSD